MSSYPPGKGQSRRQAANRRKPKRGRPAKFNRPSRLVTVTLPEDVIDALRSVHPDLAWAIVELTESVKKAGVGEETRETGVPVAELVQLANGQSLIVVRDGLLRNVPADVECIPLSNGRSIIEFRNSTGVAELELAILERLGERTLEREEKTALNQVREKLRAWRLDSTIQFRPKSIMVVEGTSPVSHRLSFQFPWSRAVSLGLRNKVAQVASAMLGGIGEFPLHALI